MITYETIDGRAATIIYINDEFEPVSADAATMIKIVFENGEIRFGVKSAKDQRKSKFQAEKRRARELLDRDFNPSQPRDPDGKWSGGGSGDGGTSGTSGTSGSPSPHAKDPKSASSLLTINHDATVDSVIARVEGADKQVAMARTFMKNGGIATDELVSAGGYKLEKGPKGKWTPEREALHREIVRELMPESAIAAATPKPGEQPTLHILGGRGGSGKGWFTGKKGTVSKAGSIYLNSDDVKERLPEYKGWNAGHLHEESSHVGEVMETQAREKGLNVIIDATLKSGDSTERRITAYKKAGYRIFGHYMYTAPDKAAERALQRFVRGNEENGKGRFVAPEYTMESKTNEHSFDEHRKDMDAWEVYDNNGKAPVFHSRGGKW